MGDGFKGLVQQRRDLEVMISQLPTMEEVQKILDISLIQSSNIINELISSDKEVVKVDKNGNEFSTPLVTAGEKVMAFNSLVNYGKFVESRLENERRGSGSLAIEIDELSEKEGD